MLALRPSPELSTRSPVPAQTPAPTRRPTAPAPAKLRDSCHACASSKVKCHKEKPTCSRCTKRGLACEYFVTKRSGRKHDKSSSKASVTVINQTQALSSSNWPPSSSASSGTDYLISPSLIQSSPRQSTPTSSSSNLVNLFSPIDPFLSSVFTNLSTGLDDFFRSSTSIPPTESSDCDSLCQSNFYSRDGADNSKRGFDSSDGAITLFGPLDTINVFESPTEFPDLSRPHSPPNSQDDPPREPHSDHGIQPLTHPPSGCLVYALGLLKRLSPMTPTCSFSSASDNENVARQLPTRETVMSENGQVIEALSNMLQCSCSRDGYLLAIISLIVFKVLGWYAAAARGTPAVASDGQCPEKSPQSRYSSNPEQVHQHPTVAGGYSIDGEGRGRMATQLVLNELHHVQRLVNQLSQKLKSYGTETMTLDPLFLL